MRLGEGAEVWSVAPAGDGAVRRRGGGGARRGGGAALTWAAGGRADRCWRRPRACCCCSACSGQGVSCLPHHHPGCRWSSRYLYSLNQRTVQWQRIICYNVTGINSMTLYVCTVCNFHWHNFKKTTTVTYKDT